MKKVFSSHRELCHVWASRTQDEGRSGNISFNKDIILSYHWWPMAKFINDNTVLIVDHPYSNSTAKHINYVCRAIPPEYKRLYVNCPADRYSYNVPHENNLNAFVSTIKGYFDKFPKSLKYKGQIIRGQNEVINELHQYCNLFNLSAPSYQEFSLQNDIYYSQVSKQEEHLKELEAKKEAERVRILANLSGEINKAENDWMNGASNKTNFYHKKIGSYSFSQTRLRAKDDRIETSQGANVPIKEARILFDRIQNGQDVKGWQIGYYTVISLNGVLKIGCHKIERDEINRLAKSLNWI